MSKRRPDRRDRIAVADAFSGAGWYLWVSPRLQFYAGNKKPNAWRQFWQWALLGWHYTKEGEPHPEERNKPRAL